MDVPQTPGSVGNLAEEDRPAVTKSGGEPAELVAGVRLCHGRRSLRKTVAREEMQALGTP
jgi:hypothetical protein